MSSEQSNCFVIGPISDPGTETRVRSDKLLRNIIEPAATACGYSAVRSDAIAEPGEITNQVIDHVLNDAMLVADLSEHNPNVYYELAIRHAHRKPFVHLIGEQYRLPFDVQGIRVIRFVLEDPDNVRESKDQLIESMKFAGDHPEKLKTPVSFALQLQALNSSENIYEKGLADLLNGFQRLQASIDTQLPQSNESLMVIAIVEQMLREVEKRVDPSETNLRTMNLPELYKLRNNIRSYRHFLAKVRFLLHAYPPFLTPVARQEGLSNLLSLIRDPSRLTFPAFDVEEMSVNDASFATPRTMGGGAIPWDSQTGTAPDVGD